MSDQALLAPILGAGTAGLAPVGAAGRASYIGDEAGNGDSFLEFGEVSRKLSNVRNEGATLLADDAPRLL